MKLTAMQISTLRLIRDGAVSEVRHGYGAWRIHGANPSTVGRLRSLGFCEKKRSGTDGDYQFRLTEAGTSILSEVDG